MIKSNVWLAIFSLGGLLTTLQSAHKDDFISSYHDIYEMTLNSYRILALYEGDDQNLINGKQTMLEALPKFNLMFPNLYYDLGLISKPS